MSAELSQVAGAPARGWKPYLAYKDSGVEWLGKVPEHWEIKKLKYLVKDFLKYGANESAELEDTNLPRYIRITDFGNDGKLKQDTFKSLSHDIAKDYLLENGDILFARSGATVGKTFQFKNYKGLACFAGYLIKATPDEKKVLSDYLYLFTKSNSYETWKNGIFIQATIQNIGADKYNYLQITIPPIPEQHAIARFLDDRTRKIDSLIEKKQKLIELLKEERAAIINQAVTKGLDLRAPMRDSGVEWMGKVPEKWEVKRLKYLVTLVNEKSNSDSIVVKIALENIESNTGKLVNLDSETIFEGEARTFMRGDVLFNKLRPYLAKVYNAKTNGVCVGELLVFRPSKSLISDFLYYRVLSEDFIKEVNSSTYGAKMPRASWEFIGNMLIPFPAIEEQREIIKFIESEYAGIDRVVSKIEKEIAFLQEYRTALISEVVTGKIDVRGE